MRGVRYRLPNRLPGRLNVGTFRTWLALLVVIAHIHIDQHAHVGFSGGAIIAVRIFFVISGFYMALILNGKYLNSAEDFYWSRALRLYPVYLATIVVTLIIDTVFLRGGHVKNWSALLSSDSFWAAPALVLANLSFIGLNDLTVICLETSSGIMSFIENDACPAGNPLNWYVIVPQAWTLGIEVLFYIIAPFILRRGVRMVLGLLIASIVLKFSVIALGMNVNPYDRYLFILEFVFFLTGAASFFFYEWLKKLNRDIIHMLAPFAPAVAIILTNIYVYVMPSYYFTNKVVLDAILDPLLIGAMFVLIPLSFMATAKSEWDNWIGELSYPIYITHVIALLVSIELANLLGIEAMWTRFSLHMTLILAVAVLTVFTIVRPIEAARGRRTLAERHASVGRIRIPRFA